MVTTTRAVMLDHLNAPENPDAVWNYRAPLWCPECGVGATYERCWFCAGPMVPTESRLMSVIRNGTCAMHGQPPEVEG